MQPAAHVTTTPGLIAFWNFAEEAPGGWVSHRDPNACDRAFRLRLRRLGDPQAYTPATWPPVSGEPPLERIAGGPFGHAIRFDRGQCFAEVPRADFTGTALDVHGRQPFTMLAWVSFWGERHLVAGVWDEGGWDRYGGRRQFALFGGLFGAKGTIAHLSATGAASYPQAEVEGAQYARMKAIDGAAFPDHQWVCMGMSYDPQAQTMEARLNGVRTASTLADPVVAVVTGQRLEKAMNPADFPWPIFSSRAFLIKFNGYSVARDGVQEHALFVDLDQESAIYRFVGAQSEVRLTLTLERAGQVIVRRTWTPDGTSRQLPGFAQASLGDVLEAVLESRLESQDWQPLGTPVRRTLSEGAPFTIARALGLGAKDASGHGSQMHVAGVALFNRVLSDAEYRELGFAGEQ